jgi:beta-lactamase regulating signal transducer with metallopeptidase domain
LQFVLRHELTHIKRGDLPLNALLCVLLSLHWFNPLLWFAFFKARLDRESACDDEVLQQEPQPGRIAYGHTLLKVESAFGYDELRLGFVGIFQRGAALVTHSIHRKKTNPASSHEKHDQHQHRVPHLPRHYQGLPDGQQRATSAD